MDVGIVIPGRAKREPGMTARASMNEAQDVVLSNTPPLDFSLRATSAYSARI
jgi:hypothetical protein